MKFSGEALDDRTLRTDYKDRHDSRDRPEEAGQEEGRGWALSRWAETVC
jgi:hypothetical protein